MKKSTLFAFLFCQFALIAIAQIPNGDFEEWQVTDSIENPVHWETNNFYVGYTPVQKISTAISGNYSMKISSTARDIFDINGTWPGCAHVKFLPSALFHYLTAFIRIDSIDMGEIDIRVKQRTANGLYEKIGGWKRSTTTQGIIPIGISIDQFALDTLLIEIWAFNTDILIMPNIGYSEVIIDNLQLTNTVATTPEPSKETAINWQISPNPTHDFLNISLEKRLTKPCQLRLFDINGRVRLESSFQTFKEEQINVSGLASGIYVLELNQDGQVLYRSRVLVHQE